MLNVPLDAATQPHDGLRIHDTSVAMQVFCNGGIPSILALCYGFSTRCSDIVLNSQQAFWPTAFLGAAIGYYASCCADTWASELGQLSEDTPVLVTTLRPVRKVMSAAVSVQIQSSVCAGRADIMAEQRLQMASGLMGGSWIMHRNVCFVWQSEAA